MSEPAQDLIVVRAHRVLWRRVLDGVLVLAPGADKPIHIGTPGELLWDLLVVPTSISDLVGTVVDFFDVEDAQAQVDVQEAIQMLSRSGVVETAARSTH